MICRLLHDISNVDKALGFWAARLKAGQHRSFLLLGQGPTSFVLDILAVITRKAERKSHLSATDQIERRVCPAFSRAAQKPRALSTLLMSCSNLQIMADLEFSGMFQKLSGI